jgi:nucleoside-diphosphate-sugar epimerase
MSATSTRVNVISPIFRCDDVVDSNGNDISTDKVRAFLEGADRSENSHVILVSSAMVYGAWENNPSPLSEDDVVRPVPSFAFAVSCLTAEALVEQWRSQQPGRSATILRPAPIVIPSGNSRLVLAVAHAVSSESVGSVMSAQFLHFDDLESAIALAQMVKPDGVFNVAPDGAISGERLSELAAHPLRVKLPRWARDVVDVLRWRLQRGPIPPGLRQYTRHSWVVSNEKLHTLGWEPRVSNEEAYIEGTTGSWISTLSAKRRQELSLAAMGVGGALLIVSAIALVRRVRRAHH